MKVKTHPLAELLAKKLFGLTTQPKEEQRLMIAKAIKAAVKWHEKEIRG